MYIAQSIIILVHSRNECVCQSCGAYNLEAENWSELWVQCDNCDDWFHL